MPHSLLCLCGWREPLDPLSIFLIHLGQCFLQAILLGTQVLQFIIHPPRPGFEFPKPKWRTPNFWGAGGGHRCVLRCGSLGARVCAFVECALVLARALLRREHCHKPSLLFAAFVPLAYVKGQAAVFVGAYTHTATILALMVVTQHLCVCVTSARCSDVMLA